MCDIIIMYLNCSGSLTMVFKNDWAMGGSGFICMVQGGEGILPCLFHHINDNFSDVIILTYHACPAAVWMFNCASSVTDHR